MARMVGGHLPALTTSLVERTFVAAAPISLWDIPPPPAWLWVPARDTKLLPPPTHNPDGTPTFPFPAPIDRQDGSRAGHSGGRPSPHPAGWLVIRCARRGAHCTWFPLPSSPACHSQPCPAQPLPNEPPSYPAARPPSHDRCRPRHTNVRMCGRTSLPQCRAPARGGGAAPTSRLAVAGSWVRLTTASRRERVEGGGGRSPRCRRYKLRQTRARASQGHRTWCGRGW